MDTITQETWEPTAAPAESGLSAERPLQIRFTGSGSEYFRIWIVNLLLSIVTLSLYRPWAKVRRLRYFYANTLVDGHAFDFHGDPKKMLRGYLLVGLMVICYSAAGRFSPGAAMVAVVIFAVVFPALLRASMQFRLANTSWRSLRFRFSGSLGGAYRAMLPLFVPTLLFAIMGLGITDRLHPPSWYFKALGLILLLTFLLAPLVWWNFKRYQHNHYGLGQWQTRLTIGPGSMYGLTFKVFGVMLLSGVAVLVFAVILVVIVAVSLGLSSGFNPEAFSKSQPMLAVASILIGFLLYFFGLIVPVPYAMSRTQNLIWPNTRCDELRFDSKLLFGPLTGLTVKNWLLMVLTLGLYYPFASVAFYRMRVESLTPQLSGNLDQLQAQAAAAGDASGDAAGDFFGIDIGL
jgi:uncharacterized membrane protein YjgN (DUF898 family)